MMELEQKQHKILKKSGLALGLWLLSTGYALAAPLLYDVRYNPLTTGETEVDQIRKDLMPHTAVAR